MRFEEWNGFNDGEWTNEINVRNFIQKNYTPYYDGASFLANHTKRTENLWNKVLDLYKKESEAGGVLEVSNNISSSITSHKPGYIDKKNEVIVGLQTDKPLKRAIMPNGGIRIVEKSCEAYNTSVSDKIEDVFHNYRRTHNDGVFMAYTPEIRAARSSHLITGLPDGYGRGRIIGDYRRVALYGIDFLIEEKRKDLKSLELNCITENTIRDREEHADQISALEELKVMAASYGCDISKPASNAQEAVQWTYFGYLGAIKEQNGAAMSLGRTSTFLDIYFERDLKNEIITEEEAQEIMDHFVMKLRMVRFLRTPEYNELFSGDPVWVTESIGGMGIDGRTLVTKNSFRILHTLETLGPAPEPNLTVLWSNRLPREFKNYCAKLSITTSSIQYENDDLMREYWGDDYGIACCVSAMRIGKQMQFFGARANLAKTLLYAINGGRDEKTGKQVTEKMIPVTSEYLDFDEVWKKFDKMCDWVARVYINALNIIHYMHDKYCYEKLEMALHDKDIYRTMATGIAGLSIVADSFSAMKYAKVKVIRDETGLAVNYEIEGDFPKYGNDDDRVDSLATMVLEKIFSELSKHECYRNAHPTLSVLTITSNVVYGSKTGSTPDGRKAGVAFAPGANPMHGRDVSGAIASLNSVAKIDYQNCCRDGVSNTFSIVPASLGKTLDEQVNNLVTVLDGYFVQGAHHLNVNVLNRETLIDAMNNPEKYPLLTIRVSGYAVRFNRLTKKQQEEVISRTFHDKL